MSGTGIPSCVFRLICIVPLIVMTTDAPKLYKAASRLEGSLYDAIPHGNSFIQGLKIVLVAVSRIYSYFVWTSETNAGPRGR